jgi:hypothetical protein
MSQTQWHQFTVNYFDVTEAKKKDPPKKKKKNYDSSPFAAAASLS